MPYLKVYIHFVWSTKNRIPFLNSFELRQALWAHMLQNAITKGIFVDAISGQEDHCHCLVRLTGDQTMSKVMQLLKGESSFWVNKNNFCKHKFQWQEEYFAISVSESIVDRVRHYIKNQEDHHRKNTFKDEYDDLMEKIATS